MYDVNVYLYFCSFVGTTHKHICNMHTDPALEQLSVGHTAICSLRGSNLLNVTQKLNPLVIAPTMPSKDIVEYIFMLNFI